MEKRGRKKKRGPKKKKIPVPHTYVGLKRPYHIITSNNGIQLEDIYTSVDLPRALNKLKELSEKLNENIQFPVRFTSTRGEKKFHECDYRLILIKKKGENDISEGKSKNEYGKYIDCSTDNDKWLFIEDIPYKVEETFWVYGYNPKCQRKNYQFIIDNFILNESKNKYYIRQVVIFKNKLLINSVDKLDMIICKNHQDSVRFYNKISELVSLKKLKYVILGGDINTNSYSFYTWYNKIKTLTNWTNRKIMQNTTRD